MRPLNDVVNSKKKGRKNIPSQLYILSCGDLIKIGVTNDIEQRIRTLQTGNPLPIILEHIETKNHPYKIESYLHRIFAQYRIRGEWFSGILVRDIRAKMLMYHDYD